MHCLKKQPLHQVIGQHVIKNLFTGIHQTLDLAIQMTEQLLGFNGYFQCANP